MPLLPRTASARLPRVLGLALGLFAFAAAHGAEAASAYFAPTSGDRGVGSTFTVSINASSPDQAINGAEITVGFPADRLQVVSLSKSSSFISFWVEEPSFSNADGVIRAQGVIPNPGWKGSAGHLLSVTFRATGEGPAPLRFVSGSLLANDGLGTNVLTTFGSANFSVGAAGQAPSTEEEGTRPPAAVAIVSTGFPDQDAWYRPGDLGFAWKRAQGVTGASYLLDASATTTPDTVSEGNVGAAAFKDPGDGVWYFHLRVRNALGWSGATHYRVQLDGTPPSAITMEEVGADDGSTRYRIAAADPISGVSLFRIGIDDGPSIDWQPTEDGLYEPPQLLPGTYVVTIEAIDRAGNSAVMDFRIEQVSIRPPSVSYTKRLVEGAAFDISGFWAAGLRVALGLRAADRTASVLTETADSDGRFSFAFPEGLSAGTYAFTLWASDSEGRTSAETPAREFLVVPKDADAMDGTRKNFFAGLMEKAGSPVVVALALAAIVLIAAFLATLRARRAFHRGLARYKLAIRKAFAEAERESAGHEHPGLHRAEKLVQQAIRELEKILK